MSCRKTHYVFLLLFSCLLISLTQPVYTLHDRYVSENISPVVDLPAELSLITALEFKGVGSDILFLKTMTFMGARLLAQAEPDREQWQRMARMLHLITELDGRFLDPYIFAQMFFPWQADMLDEANVLLLKAAKNLPNDYRPYYFLGFNAFYFQKNATLAAGYLRRAALSPNVPEYIKGLAARFILYGNDTYQGIVFLEQLLGETANEGAEMYLEKRLDALKKIYFLEQKVQDYVKIYNRNPASLDDLISAGILRNIPDDPYGGTFTITPAGMVYTTSKMVQQSNVPSSEATNSLEQSGGTIGDRPR